MQLQEISDSEKDSYNQFVAANESGSFLQSWEWGEWQAALGRQVKSFKWKVESGETVGTVLLIKMTLPFGKHYWYAPYGPVLAGGEQLPSSAKAMEGRKVESEKFQDVVRGLRSKFPEAMFIRLEPKNLLEGLPSSATKSTNIQPAITIVLDIKKPDEVLLAGMHPKTRYNIRLAAKHGVVIQSELVVTPKHGLYAREAVDLILQTQRRQKYRGHSLNYYQKLVDFFAVQNPNGDLKLRVYKALYNRELVASAIMVDFGKTRMYLYGGSSENFRNIMAPYLLHWQAIMDAREAGLNFYDFGGSEVSAGGEKGFTRFKQGFGGVVINYAGAYDIINHKSAYKFYGIVRKLNKLIRS